MSSPTMKTMRVARAGAGLGGAVPRTEAVLELERVGGGYLLHVSAPHQLRPEVEVLPVGLLQVQQQHLVGLLQVTLQHNIIILQFKNFLRHY